MIRFVLAMLVARLIISCAVDETDTSGTLTFNPDQDIEIPEWLSVKDVDHNKDGTINILDLVAVARFHGQEVPDGNKNATINTIELGTKQVGELFRTTGAESVQRLEAHNSNGKVEGALARWQTAEGADIFSVRGTTQLF